MSVSPLRCRRRYLMTPIKTLSAVLLFAGALASGAAAAHGGVRFGFNFGFPVYAPYYYYPPPAYYYPRPYYYPPAYYPPAVAMAPAAPPAYIEQNHSAAAAPGDQYWYYC